MHKNTKKALLLGILFTSATLLTGCKKVTDALYYLFDSEYAIKKDPKYVTYDAENGVTVEYDANIWEEPFMVQEDTVNIVCGNSINYTVVMFQTTDTYTDFLKQSEEELMEETAVIPEECFFEVPDAESKFALYNCGLYQTLLGEITFPEETIYLTAATYSGDIEKIEDLVKRVHPTSMNTSQQS